MFSFSKVGSTVEVKTLDGRLMDGVIIKLTDASTYTVGKSLLMLL